MFEQNLQNAMFSGNKEKTFLDKLLAKDDVDRLQELIKRPKLTRSELLELLYLLGGVESKLLNYGEWDRYVSLKFFVWIREFIKVAEILFDYTDDLYRKQNSCKFCGGFKDKSVLPSGGNFKVCSCGRFKARIILSERTKQLLYNNERYIEHNAKFLIDLYLNIGRTTLSLGGTGFMEALKNKYEIAYPVGPGINTPVQGNSSGGLWGIGKKGGA